MLKSFEIQIGKGNYIFIAEEASSVSDAISACKQLIGHFESIFQEAQKAVEEKKDGV